MFFADTVKDEIAFGLENLGIKNKDVVIDAALGEVGLLHTKTLYPRWLSRGERQRLAIACVVAMQPAIIVLDEPTTGLDGDEARLVMEILKKLQQNGHTVIVITHNRDIAQYCADRMITMDQGRVSLGYTGAGGIMSEILQYVHKDGFFHRLHPFSKILFIIVISVMCVFVTSIPFLILMVVALLFLAYISHLHREVIQQLKLVLIMSVVFIIITVLTMPNGATLGYLIPQGVPVIGGSIANNRRGNRDRSRPCAPVHGADLRVPALPYLYPAP